MEQVEWHKKTNNFSPKQNCGKSEDKTVDFSKSKFNALNKKSCFVENLLLNHHLGKLMVTEWRRWQKSNVLKQLEKKTLLFNEGKWWTFNVR